MVKNIALSRDFSSLIYSQIQQSAVPISANNTWVWAKISGYFCMVAKKIVALKCLVQFSVTIFIQRSCFPRSHWSKKVRADWLLEAALNKSGYTKLYQTFYVCHSLSQHTINTIVECSKTSYNSNFPEKEGRGGCSISKFPFSRNKTGFSWPLRSTENFKTVKRESVHPAFFAARSFRSSERVASDFRMHFEALLRPLSLSFFDLGETFLKPFPVRPLNFGQNKSHG